MNYHDTIEYSIWLTELHRRTIKTHPEWDGETVNRFLSLTETNMFQCHPEFFLGMVVRAAKELPEIEYDFHIWDLKSEDFRIRLAAGIMPDDSKLTHQECGGLTLGNLDIEVVVSPNAGPQYCILVKEPDGTWEANGLSDRTPTVPWLVQDWATYLESELQIELARYANEYGLSFVECNIPTWKR